MKKVLLFFIFCLILAGCGDKESIYDSINDADQLKTDNEKDDEGGCGPGKDETVEESDTDDKDEVDLVDETDIEDEDNAIDDKDIKDDVDKQDTILIDEDIDEDNEVVDDSDSPCPLDMVESGNICIDKYEASRSDATETDQGTGTDKAFSKAGVLPWMVNPMNETHFAQFKAACVSVGKRLCKDDEWTASCQGPDESTYSWGNTFDKEICNNVDAFCDDHCADNGISSEECSNGTNCGYTYSCFTVVPTRSFENCINNAGAFDINGNVWEITDAGSEYRTRGGAFNCAGAADRLSCSYNAGWSALYAGFRCCKDKN